MTQKAPRLLHPEQESTTKQPWERQPGEKAADFMRFRTYLLMGRGRTLQAVAEQEKQLKTKAKKGTTVDAVDEPKKEDAQGVSTSVKVSISGALKRASVRWQWRERAALYDDHIRTEQHKNLLGFLDHECDYITRAQRLAALDAVVHSLMTELLGNHYTQSSVNFYLACVRQIRLVLREIAREMAAVDKMQVSSLSEAADRMM